jgi:hypothetical protein
MICSKKEQQENPEVIIGALQTYENSLKGLNKMKEMHGAESTEDLCSTSSDDGELASTSTAGSASHHPSHPPPSTSISSPSIGTEFSWFTAIEDTISL